MSGGLRAPLGQCGPGRGRRPLPPRDPTLPLPHPSLRIPSLANPPPHQEATPPPGFECDRKTSHAFSEAVRVSHLSHGHSAMVWLRQRGGVNTPWGRAEVFTGFPKPLPPPSTIILQGLFFSDATAHYPPPPQSVPSLPPTVGGLRAAPHRVRGGVVRGSPVGSRRRAAPVPRARGGGGCCPSRRNPDLWFTATQSALNSTEPSPDCVTGRKKTRGTSSNFFESESLI